MHMHMYALSGSCSHAYFRGDHENSRITVMIGTKLPNSALAAHLMIQFVLLVYQCQNEHAGFGWTRGVRLDIALPGTVVSQSKD